MLPSTPPNRMTCCGEVPLHAQASTPASCPDLTLSRACTVGCVRMRALTLSIRTLTSPLFPRHTAAIATTSQRSCAWRFRGNRSRTGSTAPRKQAPPPSRRSMLRSRSRECLFACISTLHPRSVQPHMRSCIYVDISGTREPVRAEGRGHCQHQGDTGPHICHHCRARVCRSCRARKLGAETHHGGR